MLRLADPVEFPAVQAVYAESMAYALARHGGTDWDISYKYLDYLDTNEELYVSEGLRGGTGGVALHGAVVLSERFNPQEWEGTEPEGGLYVGKFATANTVRGTRYATEVMLPGIIRIAGAWGKTSVRLNFMDDNDGLRRLYEDMGFTPAGTTTFFSETRAKELTTVNMIKEVSR